MLYWEKGQFTITATLNWAQNWRIKEKAWQIPLLIILCLFNMVKEQLAVCLAILMNQFISVYKILNLYLCYDSDQKTPEYTLKLQNQ